MRKQLLLAAVVAALGSLTAVLVAAGCGGSGGSLVHPGGGGGNGGVTAAFLALLPDAQRSATYVGTPKCQSCHNDNYHAGWSNTKHAQVGTGCEQCHGAGSVHATNRTANVVQADILTYPNVTEPTVCAQCHGPISDQLMNSRHASVVADVIASAHASPAGGKTCLRCHGAPFKTQFINAPWTKGLIQGLDVATIQNQADTDINALTNAQVDALATASHQSANCVTCHDPHTRTGKLLSTGEEKQLRRSSSSLDTTPIAPGSPGKVTSNFDHICGTCHNGRGGDPSDAALRTANATARPNFHEGPTMNMLLGITGSLGPGTVVQQTTHAIAPDQCVHCHMPDASHTFTVKLDTSCAPCHSPADAANREGQVQNEIITGLLALRTRMETWAQKTLGNSEFWDYYTLADPDPAVQTQLQGLQPQVPIEIRRARHNYYFMVRERSFGVHNAFYARQLLAWAHTQLDNLGISRAAPPPISRAAAKRLLTLDMLKAVKSERMTAF